MAVAGTIAVAASRASSTQTRYTEEEKRLSMNTITRYLRFIRPFFEFDSYWQKPCNVADFIGTLLYCNFDVAFCGTSLSVGLTLFSFGFNLSVEEPFTVQVRLKALCGDVCVGTGLHTDWKAQDLFNEADEKRERFAAACAVAELTGISIDTAYWESEDSRKERIHKIRSDFRHSLWKSENEEIPLGNEMWLVFEEDGARAVFRASAGLDLGPHGFHSSAVIVDDPSDVLDDNSQLHPPRAPWSSEEFDDMLNGLKSVCVGFDGGPEGESGPEGEEFSDTQHDPANLEPVAGDKAISHLLDTYEIQAGPPAPQGVTLDDWAETRRKRAESLEEIPFNLHDSTAQPGHLH